jgi:hypothetical protein
MCGVVGGGDGVEMSLQSTVRWPPKAYLHALYPITFPLLRCTPCRLHCLTIVGSVVHLGNGAVESALSNIRQPFKLQTPGHIIQG